MSDKPNKKRTKPPAEIDLVELERCAAAGFTLAETAQHLRISESTLYKHKAENGEIGEALKRGKLSAHAEVSSKLFEQCKGGNVAAIIWYEKTRRGMTDKVNISVEDVDRAIERELARVAGGDEAGNAQTSQAETAH